MGTQQRPCQSLAHSPANPLTHSHTGTLTDNGVDSAGVNAAAEALKKVTLPLTRSDAHVVQERVVSTDRHRTCPPLLCML